MIRYERIDRLLFETNRSRLINLLPPSSLAIIQSNDRMPRNGDQFFPFRQNSDFFFLTGVEEEKSILLLCPNHPNEQVREVLFIPHYTADQLQWEGEKYTPSLAGSVSGIANVRYLDTFDSALKEAMEYCVTVFLNGNEYPRFTTEVLSRDLRFASHLRQSFPVHTYARLAPLLKELRLIKQEQEIALMRKACGISGEVFEEVLQMTSPGSIEYDIEACISSGFMRRAAENAYPPIVASGRNSCVLHYTHNNSPLRDGDLLLLDFGAEYANYASDCSRTIPVNGKFTPRQREVYQAVLSVFKAAKDLIRPGITINKLNEKVGTLIEAELIKLGLLTIELVNKQDPQRPLFHRYFMHGVSHFIGLDVHDPGSKDVVIRKGMVLSCEPGIYIPEENIGIRLENTLLVGDKAIDLMQDIPIEVDDIERLMAAR